MTEPTAGRPTALPDFCASLGGRREAVLLCAGALVVGGLLAGLLLSVPVRWGAGTKIGVPVCIGLAVAALISRDRSSKRVPAAVAASVVCSAAGVATYLFGSATTGLHIGLVAADAQSGVLSVEAVAVGLGAITVTAAMVGFVAAFAGAVMLAETLNTTSTDTSGVWGKRIAVMMGSGVAVFGLGVAMYFTWLTLVTLNGHG